NLIDGANAKHGCIDILVNNLGGSRNANIWEMSVADFDFVLRLNLRSTFLVTRAAAPHMMKRRQVLSSAYRRGPERARRGPPTIGAEPPTRWRRPVCTASFATWRWNSPSTTLPSMPWHRAPSTPSGLGQASAGSMRRWRGARAR